MAFPKMIKKGWWIFSYYESIDWEDRGRVPFFIEGKHEKYKGHPFCGARAHVGRDKAGPFMYCPLCLIKLK